MPDGDSADDLLATLADMTANLQRYIGQRAYELAEPAMLNAENRARADRQRWLDAKPDIRTLLDCGCPRDGDNAGRWAAAAARLRAALGAPDA